MYLSCSSYGWVMLPWFLVKVEEWYTSIDIENFRIKLTASGWINPETAIYWLYLFIKATYEKPSFKRPTEVFVNG